MRIRVLFFGQLKDIVECSEDTLELPAGARVETVFRHYASQFPGLGAMADSIAIARNREFSGPDAGLEDGDEVALMPPVSGGVALPAVRESADAYFAVTSDAIDSSALRRRVQSNGDGALLTFEGVVRDNSQGRKTRYLDYECYVPLALNTIEEIGRAVLERFDARRNRHCPPRGASRNPRNQHSDRCRRRAPAGRLRGKPRRDRYGQEAGPGLEERVLRGWRGLGRRAVGRRYSHGRSEPPRRADRLPGPGGVMAGRGRLRPSPRGDRIYRRRQFGQPAGHGERRARRAGCGPDPRRLPRYGRRQAARDCRIRKAHEPPAVRRADGGRELEHGGRAQVRARGRLAVSGKPVGRRVASGRPGRGLQIFRLRRDACALYAPAGAADKGIERGAAGNRHVGL